MENTNNNADGFDWRFLIEKGAILGVALCGLNVIYYTTGMWKSMTGGLLLLGLSLVVFGVLFVLFTFNIKSERHSRGKIAKLGDIFVNLVLVALLSSVLTVGYSIVFSKVIDPSFEVKALEAARDGTVEMMENFGATDEQIDQSIEQLDKQIDVAKKNPTSVFKTIWMGVLSAGGMGALVAIIIALIMRDKTDGPAGHSPVAKNDPDEFGAEQFKE